MQYFYQVFPDIEQINITYTGSINIDFVKDSIAMMICDNKFKRTYQIFIDFQNCEIAMSLEELDDFSNFYNRIFAKSPGKTALLVTSPQNTALAYLFQRYNRSDRQIEIFCTKQAADTWLHQSTSENTPNLPEENKQI